MGKLDEKMAFYTKVRSHFFVQFSCCTVSRKALRDLNGALLRVLLLGMRTKCL